MVALDVPSLLQPLGEDAPCGADLSSAQAFVQLAQAAEGRPEQQFGDRVYPAQPPDWAAVHEGALALWPDTRDLRIAVLLTRAQTRLAGLRGCAAGLDLIAGLVETHWDRLHPLLDADEADDPTERLNALGALVDPRGLPGDLREATLDGDRRTLRLSEAWRLADAQDPTGADERRAALREALSEAARVQPGLLEDLVRADEALQRLHAALVQRLGTRAPDFKPLRDATRPLAQAAAELLGRTGALPGADLAPPASSPAAPASSPAGSVPGELRSRADAAAALERVCSWLERHEPAHPAPLLIRRAQRLLDKGFLDIVRDLAPDGLAQVEHLAGRTNG